MKITAYLCLLVMILAVSGCNKGTRNYDIATTEQLVEEPIETTVLPAEETEVTTEFATDGYPKLERMLGDDSSFILGISMISFTDAIKLGEAVKEKGENASQMSGDWYTIRVGGVEYFYIVNTKERLESFRGLAVTGEGSGLGNGIMIGTSEEEICEKYPNVAIMNFDNTYISEPREDNKGWRVDEYPESWLSRFDYVITAGLDPVESRANTAYIALMMKDKAVAAITYYTWVDWE